MALVNPVYRDQLYPRRAYASAFEILLTRESEKQACRRLRGTHRRSPAQPRSRARWRSGMKRPIPPMQPYRTPPHRAAPSRHQSNVSQVRRAIPRGSLARRALSCGAGRARNCRPWRRSARRAECSRVHLNQPAFHEFADNTFRVGGIAKPWASGPIMNGQKQIENCGRHLEHPCVLGTRHGRDGKWRIAVTRAAFRRGGCEAVAAKQPIWWHEEICDENNVHVVIGKDDYFLSTDGLLMPAKKDQGPPDLRYFKPANR